jgi:hypothetical protein
VDTVVPALLGSVAAVATSWAALEGMEWYRGRARRQRFSKVAGQRQTTVVTACSAGQARSADAWRRVIEDSVATLANRFLTRRQTPPESRNEVGGDGRDHTSA